jgi:hypothetical protein
MFVGYVYWERGDPASAIQTMSDCVRVAADAGLVMALVGTRADLGWLYGALGAAEQGLALARLAQATAEQRLPVFRPWALGCLARLQVMAGDLAAAEQSVTSAYAGLDLDDLSTHGAIQVPLADAELALARHEGPRAGRLMDDLLARLRRVGMRPFLADTLYLKAQALLAQDDSEAAYDVLSTALAEADSLGSKRMLWQILAALSALEARRGHDAEASRLRAQAREIIATIADHIPTADLRSAFLQQPSVRAVFQ